MADEHALIFVDQEKWSALSGPRDAYDPATKTWKHVEQTTWSMVGKNTWGGKAWETILDFDASPTVDAEVIVTCPLIYPTELSIEAEINVVAGEEDFAKLLLEGLPWYLRDDQTIKNSCVAMGAMLATVESYLVLIDQSRNLATTIELLENYEDEMGIKAGQLSLTQRRDNIRRLWQMMDENVPWSQKDVYYLPFIGKYSASNQHVDGTVIHDGVHKNNPTVQAKVAQWANVNGLEVVE